MASYIIGVDNINSHTKDMGYINHLKDKLQTAGHTVESVGRGPNVVQAKGKQSSSSGKIGVQIAGGMCGWTAADMAHGVGKYYHYDSMAIVGSAEFNGFHETLSTKAMTTYHMVRPHDARPGLENMYQGKTPSEFNSEYGSKCRICLGDTFDDAIRLLLEGTSSTKSGDEKGSTFKDMIKELISVWKGEVLCFAKGEELFIQKIPLPSDNYKRIQESVNIVHDTFKGTDINPETINTLLIYYANGKSFTLKDEKLISRFGEKKDTFKAIKYVVKPKEKKVENPKKDTSVQKGTNNTQTQTNDKKEDEQNSILMEKPITNYKEALQYGISKFYQIKSDDGRKIELEIIGETDLEHGDWIQLYVPFFNEECFMFVESTSVSLNPDSNYITSICLVDAPPVLSEPKLEDDQPTQPTEKPKEESKGDGKNSSHK